MAALSDSGDVGGWVSAEFRQVTVGAEVIDSVTGHCHATRRNGEHFDALVRLLVPSRDWRKREVCSGLSYYNL